MAEIETKPEGSAKVSTENLTEWFESKRDAEPASESAGAVESSDAKPASPAEPTVAEPKAEPQPASWKDIAIGDDVDHGFFKGKKVGDLYQSYRHVETAKQQAERERNELRQRLEQIERERQAAPQPRQPEADPLAGIDQLMFENPAEYTKRIREQAIEEARQAAAQTFEQHWQAKTQEQQFNTVLSDGDRAYTEAQKELSVDPVIFNKRMPGVLLHLTNPNSEYYGDGEGIRSKERMIAVYKDLYGEPQKPTPAPIVMVPPAPEPPPPPGTRKSSSVARTPDAEASPLSREQIAARRRLAEEYGLDADKWIERAKARKGASRG